MVIPRDAIASDEAARILAVTMDNLHQMVHRSLVPAARVGRSLLFSKKSIERIAAHRNETKPGLKPNPRPRSKKK